MKHFWLSPIMLACTVGGLMVGCMDHNPNSLAYYDHWPQIHSAIPKDPAIEQRVADIVAQMTLEEKVGQMIQPNISEVTPEEAGEYKLGSLLNGGGAWPNNDKHASAQVWANTADAYWQAVNTAYANRPFRIPFMWATDAVHGHNNVFQATVFPHNIGLGAAHDPQLIERIGEITAQEVAATGLDWTFAPTVTTPRNVRWGRTYEGYSEDPTIVYQYAAQVVKGLEGDADQLKDDHHVISNVKHFVGDGGTLNGDDQGENHYSEDYLRNIHATGYFSGLNAGAQVVMASFNSWHNPANYSILDARTGEHDPDYNMKIHGSAYLIGDVLKTQMGFDGLVVSDWNGQGQIDGCSNQDCPAAINAGIDIMMVTANADWKAFYQNTINEVQSGQIAMSRIDDAVTRILRVKMRAGLWQKPDPAARSLAGDQSVLGSPEHRAVARQAVRESLVLLKNNDHILPLSRDQHVLVTGSAANDIQKQTGGWSLTWQGTDNTKADFPGATTVWDAVSELLPEQQRVLDPTASNTDLNTIDVALVVIGEDPYAEGNGDIEDNQTLAYSELKPSYAADLQTLQRLHDAGIPTVTVFFSGRPLYVNPELNLSQAFVAAWLPGTEGVGITDVLFKDAEGNTAYDFRGKLSYSWPNNKCSTAINRIPPNIPHYQVPSSEQDPRKAEFAPLFAYGYGLNYESTNGDMSHLVLDQRNYGCGQDQPSDSGTADSPLVIFGNGSDGSHQLYIGDPSNWSQPVSINNSSSLPNVTAQPVDYQLQQDAQQITMNGNGAAEVYAQTSDNQAVDRTAFVNADSTLQFTIRQHSHPEGMAHIAMHCEYPCSGELEAVDYFNQLPLEQWHTVKIPLSCFAQNGMNFTQTNTPFLLYSEAPWSFDIANIRWVPASEDSSDILQCSELN